MKQHDCWADPAPASVVDWKLCSFLLDSWPLTFLLSRVILTQQELHQQFRAAGGGWIRSQTAETSHLLFLAARLFGRCSCSLDKHVVITEQLSSWLWRLTQANEQLRGWNFFVLFCRAAFGWIAAHVIPELMLSVRAAVAADCGGREQLRPVSRGEVQEASLRSIGVGSEHNKQNTTDDEQRLVSVCRGISTGGLHWANGSKTWFLN